MRISIAILALVAVIPTFSAKEINVLDNTVQQADTGIVNQIKNVVMLKRSKIIRLEQEEPEAENMTDEQMDQIIEGQIEAEGSSGSSSSSSSKSIKKVNAPHYQIIPQQVSRAPASFSQHAALAEASFPFFPTLDQDQQKEDNFGLLPPEEIINEEQNI